MHELSIDIIMSVFPCDDQQKWKHCVRKLQTIHCIPSILITEERKRQLKRQMKSNTHTHTNVSITCKPREISLTLYRRREGISVLF